MSESERNGMPIYLDPTARRLVASGDDLDEDGLWYPSNVPARRLWACSEVLTDINDLLEDGMAAKNSGKKKRKAKLIAGQTHTFAKAINGLLASIIGDRQIRKELGADHLKAVQEIQNDFAAFVPFQWGTDLSTYRNKLVAHFDDAFWPKDATELLNAIPTNKIGQWLHICLHVLLDITKLKVFAWSCSSPHPGYVRFMHNEPFIVTIKIDKSTNEIMQLAGVDIANDSPKNAIPELVGQTIEYSQWMFKKGQQRIRGLREDSKDEWNTFKDAREFYASGI